MKFWKWLSGKKTLIGVILGYAVLRLQAHGVAVPEEVLWFADLILGLGLAHKGLKALPAKATATILALIAVILPASLGGCTTTPTDQMAGQQPVRTVASGWNSVATTEAGGQLRDTLGNASEGVEVPVLNKDGTVVLDGQGNPVVVRIGRGLRDINFFFGEVKIEVQATSSGTASGTTQGSTPTVTPTITPTVTIPTPGGP